VRPLAWCSRPRAAAASPEGALTGFLADPPWWFRWVVANAWLLLVPSVVLPFTRGEAEAGVLAPRLGLVVLLGAYLVYLIRRPGWLPRA